jgi:hypothetical protein
MKDLIGSRWNLSAPGMDKLTNPIVKLEKDSAAEMMVELMKAIINTQKFTDEWRGARTIMLFKGGDEANIKNWRPITINSILYRIILWRIAQMTNFIHKINGKLLYDKGQKGFLPGRAGCVEHSAISNGIISDEVKRKNDIFIASLDLRDAFGSFQQCLIERNMRFLGFPPKVIKVVMKSYKDYFIKVQMNK